MDNILSAEIIDNQQLRPSERYGYVYIITNLINNKKYLGVKEKSNFDPTYYGSGVLIKKAVNKYGKENFNVSIYKWCRTKEELYSEENRLSILWNVVSNKNWYNCMVGGCGGNTKASYTEEQNTNFRKKVSESKKSRPMTDKESLNVQKMHDAWRGSHHTDESKRKISESNKGHIVTQEMRDKMSKNHADFNGSNNPMYGDHRFAGENNPMFGKSALKGKVWITNKVDVELLVSKDEIVKYPEFVKGRLRKNQKKVKFND